jgi:hypothetical protein
METDALWLSLIPKGISSAVNGIIAVIAAAPLAAAIRKALKSRGDAAIAGK